MKKFIVFLITFFLSACAQVPQKSESAQKEQYITKKSTYIVDMCAQENMPRFKYKPLRPTKNEMASMNEKEIDARVMKYIDALENHIEHLEKVIVDTRLRVERCK